MEPVWTQRVEEKSFRLCRGSNFDRPVVQTVVGRCTDSYAGSLSFLRVDPILRFQLRLMGQRFSYKCNSQNDQNNTLHGWSAHRKVSTETQLESMIRVCVVQSRTGQTGGWKAFVTGQILLAWWINLAFCIERNNIYPQVNLFSLNAQVSLILCYTQEWRRLGCTQNIGSATHSRKTSRCVHHVD
jgi:hypothetical protein